MTGLPDDWGDGSHPEGSFSLPDDAAKISQRYAAFSRSIVFRNVLEAVELSGADLAVLEQEYIDADYRDEYANYYATTFEPWSDRCERLHFFSGRRYLGFSSLRPIRLRPICRTILAPPDPIAAHVACLADSTAHLHSEEFPIQGFPFIGQDARYGRCAHAAIWMVALYHHYVHRTRRVFTSDIVAGANLRAEIDRVSPSGGLNVIQMGTAFREIGLPVRSYDVEKFSDKNDVEKTVCWYLNSRLPVVLVTPGHSTVLIGYGRNPKNGKLFFIRHDDARGPYRVVEDWKNDELGDWRLLMAPLPGRLYLPAEGAELVARRELGVIFDTQDQLAHLAKPLDKKDLRLRTYAIQGSQYKARLRARGLPEEVISLLSRVPMSNWIWVVEAQEKAAAASGSRCVVGELAIDATSDQGDPNLLSAWFPGLSIVWRRSAKGPVTFENTAPSDALYETGTALHV